MSSRKSYGESERYFKVLEVAERYRVVPRTVRNWVKRRWLLATRKGRLIRISQAALDEFDSHR